MFDIIFKFLTKWNQFFFIWSRRTLNLIPIFELFIGLSLILIRLLFNEITEIEYNFKYEAPFYDTGSMMSFLICLEHIYVCYYLIIILIMVYWFLYLCIIDFAGWTLKNKSINLVLLNKLFKGQLIKKLNFVIIKFNFLLIIYIKEINYLYQNLNNIINFNLNEYINYLKLFKLTNNENLLNNINYTFDILGRPYIIFNQEEIKYWKFLNVVFEFINLINKDINNLNNIYINKYINKYLFYTRPKLYDFFYYLNIILYLNNKRNHNISLNFLIINLRSLYKDIFLTNQFKHSGIFEVVWAIFPTFIIICILIPSLILLYSFEDILSPKLSIKVIGNQWYWTYEFDNWIQYKQLNNTNLNKFYHKNNSNLNNLNNIKLNILNLSDNIINNNKWIDLIAVTKLLQTQWAELSYKFIEWNIYYKNYNFNIDPIQLKDHFKWEKFYNNEFIYINKNYEKFYNNNSSTQLINKNIYTHYNYNSVIIPQENLIFGTKRLLEVDNRLILPTNMTIRFLITSADVLHAFAMPELGFKVDAVPGRLNQILVFINRPGIFYGQCSELCGANHAFMPIVIQSVLPETYLNYLQTIQLKSDLN